MTEFSPSRLQTLPAELRRQIYGYLGYTIQALWTNRYEEDVLTNLESAVVSIYLHGGVRWEPTWLYDEATDPVENHPSEMPVWDRKHVGLPAKFSKALLGASKFFTNDIYPILHKKSTLHLTTSYYIQSARIDNIDFACVRRPFLFLHISRVRLNSIFKYSSTKQEPMDDLNSSCRAVQNIAIYCPSLTFLELACFSTLLRKDPRSETLNRIASSLVIAVWKAPYLEKIRLCIPAGQTEGSYLSMLRFPTTLDLNCGRTKAERLEDVVQWTRAFPSYLAVLEDSSYVERYAMEKFEMMADSSYVGKFFMEKVVKLGHSEEMARYIYDMEEMTREYINGVAGLVEQCAGARWLEPVPA